MENIIKMWGELGGAMMAVYTFPGPDLSVKTEDKDIGNGLVVRIYTPPTAPAKPLPAGVFMHGGGWVLGDLDVSCFLLQNFQPFCILSAFYICSHIVTIREFERHF
jgi:acetyl esterase/lipase